MPPVDLNKQLITAAHMGDTRRVVELLALGASVHASDNQPLVLAAGEGSTATVEALLDHGADLHAQADHALSAAARYGQNHTIIFLLARGADVNARYEAALGVAAERGHASTVEILLNHGANGRVSNDFILKEAVGEGRADVAAVLLGRYDYPASLLQQVQATALFMRDRPWREYDAMVAVIASGLQRQALRASQHPSGIMGVFSRLVAACQRASRRVRLRSAPSHPMHAAPVKPRSCHRL